MIKYSPLSFFDCDKVLTGADALGGKQLLLVFLSISEAVIPYRIEGPSINSVILNSWSVRLASLFQSPIDLTMSPLRCAYVILHWMLFSRLLNRLSNMVGSFFYLILMVPDLFERLNLLYTLFYTAIFFLTIIFKLKAPIYKHHADPACISPGCSMVYTCVGQMHGVEKFLINNPLGTSADVTVVPPQFNERLWVQLGPNFYLLAISAHSLMSHVFPKLF